MKKSFWLVAGFLLSIPVGGIIGAFIGLMTTTFIPMCCEDSGCHSCFDFYGRVGYEATGFLGFWIGLFVFPLLLISSILYIKYVIKRKYAII